MEAISAISENVAALGKAGLKSAYTALSAFALFMTLFFAVVIAVAYLIVRYKAQTKMQTFKKLAFGFSLGYAVTLSCCILFFMVARIIIKGEADINFFLILGFFALCLVYAAYAVISYAFNKTAFKIGNYVFSGLFVAYLIVLLTTIPTGGEEYKPLSFAGMYITSIVLMLVIAVPCIIFGKDNGTASPSKSVAYAGVCIAMSFALSYIKLFSMPQGGSVTLASMLPVMIYAYVFGARKGLIVGVAYGVLQCLQSPQIYQPMQVLIDYPVAFGTIAVVGLAPRLKFLKTPLIRFIVGAAACLILRYIAHFISGYYVFSSWAMAGYTALSWSLVYNLYIIVELAIILVIGVLLFSSKAFNAQLDKINSAPKTVSDDSAKEIPDDDTAGKTADDTTDLK